MKRSQKIKLGVAVALLGSAIGLAVAQPPLPGPANPTVGWEYGRLKCGPLNNPGTTRAKCIACCNLAFYTIPSFTLIDLADCLRFCDWIFGVPGTPVNGGGGGPYNP